MCQSTFDDLTGKTYFTFAVVVFEADGDADGLADGDAEADTEGEAEVGGAELTSADGDSATASDGATNCGAAPAGPPPVLPAQAVRQRTETESPRGYEARAPRHPGRSRPGPPSRARRPSLPTGSDQW